MYNQKIVAIENSLVNGQIKQMVAQIDEYGNEFWTDYIDYVEEVEWQSCFKDRYIALVNITKKYWYTKNK